MQEQVSDLNSPEELANVVPLAGICDPVIVVGAGPVGLRCVEELLRHDLGRPIWLFGEERWDPYNRVKLSSLLAGEVSLDHLDMSLPASAMSRVVHVRHCQITGIDPATRTVVDQYGRRHRYHKLVLALGSRPFVPGVEGIEQKGVYCLRSMTDIEALLARRARMRRLVVIGGGLLGLEAAKALSRDGTQVEVVQQADRVMNRQLDHAGAARVADYLRLMGIRIRTGSGLAAVLGEGQVTGVRLRNGEEVPCDSVILATGIVPNIELARAAWIKVGRGIRVSENMQTSDADIYAAGECAEFQDQVIGLVGPGLEQAAVVAARIAGEEAGYRGSVQSSQLKVAGLPVTSIGDADQLEEDASVSSLVFRNAAHYRRLFLRQGRIVAAMAVGEFPERNRVQEALTTGRYIYPWQRFRFRRQGQLWPEGSETGVSEWPADALVCQCMAVSRGKLTEATEQGACTVAALSKCTGAGTVCGSCQPLLAELAGSDARPEAVAGGKSLLGWGAAALILSLLLTLLPSLGVRDSVQQFWPPDQLWRDGLFKQISGFTLVGLVVIGLGISLRKRAGGFRWGRFDLWRVIHVLLGALALLTLVIHTGFSLGVNLNQYLMIDFLLAAVLGVAAAVLIAQQHRLSARQGKRLRDIFFWLHLVVLWPFPVLLGFHILSVYYF